MNIFDKETFTLKELCYFIQNNKIKNDYIILNSINVYSIYNIAKCYILFSSNNMDLKNYKRLLLETRHDKGFLIKSKNNKKINFREILQEFDMEFTKLIIRIKTEPNNYNININWNDFENKIGISKYELLDIFT